MLNIERNDILHYTTTHCDPCSPFIQYVQEYFFICCNWTYGSIVQ